MRQKRKAPPVHLDEAKRGCLTWSMSDFAQNNLIDDEIKYIAEEAKDSEKTGKSTTEVEITDENQQKSVYVEFMSKIQSCSTYLKICYTAITSHWTCKLGQFELKLKFGNDSLNKRFSTKLPDCHESWLYINDSGGYHILYFELNKRKTGEKQKKSDQNIAHDTCYYLVTTDFPVEYLLNMGSKHLYLECCAFDRVHGEMKVKIRLMDSGLVKLDFASEYCKISKKMATATCQLLHHFYNRQLRESIEATNTKHDKEEFFEELKSRHHKFLTSKDFGIDIVHSSLIPDLRCYQKDSVRWMLFKEKYFQSQKGVKLNEHLHPLYEPFTSLDGQQLYFCKYTGYIVKQKPLEPLERCGGILADEMGLGKTVEVLACILLNRRQGVKPVDLLPVYPKRTKPRKRRNPTLFFVKSTDDKITYYQGNKIIEELVPAAAVLSTGTSKCIPDDKDNITTPGTHSRDHPYAADTKKPEKPSFYLVDNQGSSLELEPARDSVKKAHITVIDTQYSDATGANMPAGGNTDCGVQSADGTGADMPSGRCTVGGLQSADDTQSGCDVVMAAGEGMVDGKMDIIEEDTLVGEIIPAIPLFNDAYNSLDVFHDQLKLDGSILPKDDINDDTLGSGSNGIYMVKEVVDDNEVKKMIPDDCVPTKCDDDASSSATLPYDFKQEGEHDDSHSETSTIRDYVSDQELGVDKEQQRTRKKAFKGRNTRGKHLGRPGKKTAKKGTMKPVITEKRKKVKVTKNTTKQLKVNKKKVAKTINTSSRCRRRIRLQLLQSLTLECICGETNADIYMESQLLDYAQCVCCGSYQHAYCVSYDVSDPYRGTYKCPPCIRTADPISSGATLIVVPASIASQWVTEIEKHIKRNHLKVFVYTNSHNHKQKFVQPQTLANQDIVVVDYGTLKAEVYYTNNSDGANQMDESSKELRHGKRFLKFTSCISCIDWWRVCLDEAQMVECTSTNTARMVSNLAAVNRWCVTGTPVQKDFDDLYGLLLFLGYDPYWVKYWWNELLYRPYCSGDKTPLYDALSNVMWRTCKADVINQIGIPGQTDVTHWLNFGPIEGHFYKKQYQKCAEQSRKVLSFWNDTTIKIDDLTHSLLNKVLLPLEKIRQACCHPLMVKGSYLEFQKTSVTMEELLDSMIKRTLLDCEEAHRQFVFALNALAGIYTVQDQFERAGELYRQVLLSVEEHQHTYKIRTDVMQKLHTLHNLHAVLLMDSCKMQPTLRDSEIPQQIEDLKKEYMQNKYSFVRAAEESWIKSKQSLKELEQELSPNRVWWSEVVDFANCTNDMFDNLLLKIRNVKCYQNAVELKFRFARELELVESKRKAIIKEITKLNKDPDERTVQLLSACCLLKEAHEIKKICPFCKVEQVIDDYEMLLFSITKKKQHSAIDDEVAGDVFVINKKEGNWSAGPTESQVKIIHAFVANYKGDERLMQYGATHLKVFAVLRREFKYLRLLWLGLKEQYQAVDEITMATSRMQLTDDETVQVPNLVAIKHIPARTLKYNGERINGEGALKKNLAQLMYLRNLSTSATTFESGENTDVCPICHGILGQKWSVFRCGHCYCFECAELLLGNRSVSLKSKRIVTVKCPVCRQKTNLMDVSHVCLGNKKEAEEMPVKGNHSTKVEAIVRCLRRIKADDPKAKSLVFSTWVSFLNILSTALIENNISCCMSVAGQRKQNGIEIFKQDDYMSVLLLPVRHGANGLNLIEATHVLLAEPILNPAQELQAIGRVHRIGQSKTTTVHRFMVRQTIEEHMCVLREHINTSRDCEQMSKSETNLTVRDIMELFNHTSAEGEGADDVGGQGEEGADDVGGQVEEGEGSDEVGRQNEERVVSNEEREARDEVEGQNEEVQDEELGMKDGEREAHDEVGGQDEDLHGQDIDIEGQDDNIRG